VAGAYDHDRGAAPATDPARAARAVFADALRGAAGRTGVWLLVWLMQVAAALLPAAAFHAWFRDASAHRYAPGSLFANLDGTFRTDHARALGLLDATNARTGALLAVFAVVVSAFCAGGWLQVFLDPSRGGSLRRFFFGGSRYLGRFLRLALLTLLVLALWSWVVYGPPWQRLVLGLGLGVPEADWKDLATVGSEAAAVRLFWLQDGVFALLFGLTLVWGDFTRTRLALHDTSSTVWAGLCSLFTLLRHPIRTLRPMLALLLVELLVVVAAGVVASTIEDEMFEHPELLGTGFLLLIGQLVLMSRIVVRGARYHAAIRVSRDVVRPIARPDPWRKSIGGPGGPRYPLDGDDDVTSI
jgi:hypothetical protein